MTAVLAALITAAAAGSVWHVVDAWCRRRIRAAGRGRSSEAHYLALDEVGS